MSHSGLSLGEVESSTVDHSVYSVDDFDSSTMCSLDDLDSATVTHGPSRAPSVVEIPVNPPVAPPVAQSLVCGKRCGIPVFGENKLFPSKCPCRSHQSFIDKPPMLWLTLPSGSMYCTNCWSTLQDAGKTCQDSRCNAVVLQPDALWVTDNSNDELSQERDKVRTLKVKRYHSS